jgi:tetratricopeptide (TPR) repeat protein
VRGNTRSGTLYNLLKWTLPQLQSQLAGTPRGKDLEPFIQAIQKAASQHLKRLTSPAPIQELSLKIKQLRQDGKTKGPAWVGANTTLARLQAKEGDWTGALTTLRQLFPHRQSLPDLHNRIEQVLSNLQNAALEFIRRGTPREAEQLYQAALEFSRETSTEALKPCAGPDETSPTSAEADWLCRLGYACFADGRANEAQTHWQNAIQLYQQAGEKEPGRACGAIIVELIRTPATYWALDNWLAALLANASDDPSLSSWRGLRDTLFTSLDQRLTAAGGEESNPAFHRIVVEIGQDLIPSTETSDWVLIKNYLPEMRARLQQQMGLVIPGVHIRDNLNDLPKNGYAILLEGALVASGTLQTNKIYCLASPAKLASLNISGQTIIPALHPITGAEGAWIPPEASDVLDQKDLPYWKDPLLYLVAHLQDVLAHNLEQLLDVEDVRVLLGKWRKESGAALVIDWLLVDPTARLRFGRVLRSLLAERVPITDRSAILDTVLETGLPEDDVQTVEAAVRRRLGFILPGSNPQTAHLYLPAGLEDELSFRLQRQDGKVFLAVPPQTLLTLLEELHKQVDGLKDPNQEAVLVIRRPELRPGVRRIISSDYPNLAVLSENELAEPAEAPDEAPSREPEATANA